MSVLISKNFGSFWGLLEKEIHCHPVIVNNPYCKWFKQGKANKNQMIDLFNQFAVFSKWFLLVQLMRMLNAPNVDAETHARYILANELGVGISPDGSSENQPFKTRWAHINWLRETSKSLKIKSHTLGSWDSASTSTKKFIAELEATYGNRDGEIGRGASYAIETWAAWGIGQGTNFETNNFWSELISGIRIYNSKHGLTPPNAIPLDFFQFHFESEKSHGDNVLEEIEHSFSSPEFDEEKFLNGAHKALDAIYIFWKGLDENRKKIAA